MFPFLLHRCLALRFYISGFVFPAVIRAYISGLREESESNLQHGQLELPLYYRPLVRFWLRSRSFGITSAIVWLVWITMAPVSKPRECHGGALPQAEWPEPIQRVQALAESGIATVPPRYIKPEKDRPVIDPSPEVSIPVIDLSGLEGDRREDTLREISDACRQWGFFQVINHGVPLDLVARARDVARQFFRLPLEEKQVYANTPKTYEGYGSRLGIAKGAILDWGDYFFQHLLPTCLKDVNKWPAKPSAYRETMEEYGKQLAKLCARLLVVLSTNLGLEEGYLQEAFGGENIGLCTRTNYYPRCPQPNLTLGLSSHSDPGGMTVLLPDETVRGLQVLKDGRWILVDSVPHAFIINIGDQLQILSNGIYKSVEHRVAVNSEKERLSIATFYNPDGDKLLFPARQLVNHESPPLYQPMTYNEYRLFIRQRGPLGKSQVNSIAKQPLAIPTKSTTSSSASA